MAEITFSELETGPNPTYSVIWMHGLGADGSDFEPIVPELGLPESPAVRFIFPNAPDQPVTCNGGYIMPAWYDIISLAPDNREIDEKGLVQSMSIIRQFIAREAERGVPSHRVFLAGFSQGGAVAYSTALTHPERLAGVIALSTYIPSASLIKRNLSSTNSHVPVFAAHGLDDSVVSLALGKQAIKLLETYGNVPEWQTYAMEHEVCQEEIAAIGTWLHEQITREEAPSSVGKAVLQPYSTVPAYVTKDGSEIRELMHPNTQGNQAQSLAEATIHPGTKTVLHRHFKTEEIYHVTAGTGLMTLGMQQFPVKTGDTVLIRPGTPHRIEALGDTPLRILCCCSPAYDHSDTELLTTEQDGA